MATQYRPILSKAGIVSREVKMNAWAVSYTHLTLPTSDLV